MLYHLLFPLSEQFTIFNVFRYISFRTAYAILTALVLSFILGPWIISKLSKYGVGQAIRDEGPEDHFRKEGTPTMGGILILISLFVPTLLWARLDNPYIIVTLVTTFLFGMIGFVDDYLKLIRRRNLGLMARYKFPAQVAVGLILGGVLVFFPVDHFETRISFPFFKNLLLDLGWFYIIFVMLVVVGTSNAVNLTDGLDGLAIGPTLVATTTYLAIVYLAGHAEFSSYLQIVFVKGAGELTVFCGALLGAGLGFLWFNTYPASVFMGDMGSLALGGALGTVAVISKQEILLLIVGGIFVIETLSVIVQVISYRLTGRRIFQMAPLHHHFELKGWPEPKIIVRFWIISIILALVALSTLKLR
jgi:phospho-N-acetylmuramoyl-pentapeptide-transferase